MSPTVCTNCKADLAGQDFIDEDDKPYCVPCYEKLFANTCAHCNNIISVDQQDIAYKGTHFHYDCFACSKCKTPLSGKSFVVRNNERVCSQCAGVNANQTCKSCSKKFEPGQSRCTYKDDVYHEQCFRCQYCERPIGDKSFFIQDNKLMCSACQDKNCEKCKGCNKSVNGGLRYKNNIYHSECFVCSNVQCKKQLADTKFTSHEDKPYCMDCFQLQFCDKCAKCDKPITGKYLTFCDKPFHSECFTCSKCNKSLAGSEFYEDDGNVVCAECSS